MKTKIENTRYLDATRIDIELTKQDIAILLEGGRVYETPRINAVDVVITLAEK